MSARDTAKTLFRMLSRNSDLIMDAYSSSDMEFQETEEKADVIEKLLRARIAWRPDVHENARLSKPVRELLDRHLKVERLSYLDSDMGGRMESIRSQTQTYFEVLRRGSADEAEHMISAVREQVYELSEVLHDNTRRLWNRIAQEFAYVSSLKAKVMENELAIAQAERLVEALSVIDCDELYRLAGTNKPLRRLFGTVLSSAISDARAELLDVLHRMNTMLFSFRALEQRTKQVQALYQFFQRRPGHQFDTYLNQSVIPEVFKAVKPLRPTCSANLRNSAQELILANIITGLRRNEIPDEKLSVETRVTAESEVQTPSVILIPEIKKAARKVFAQALTRDEAVTASETLTLAPQGVDLSTWIYCLAGEHNALSTSHRMLFVLQWQGLPDPIFNGNFIAQDVAICRR